jgi:hypothetical protein
VKAREGKDIEEEERVVRERKRKFGRKKGR